MKLKKTFKLYVSENKSYNIYIRIILETISNINLKKVNFCDPEEHLKTSIGIDTHEYVLIRKIIEIYYKIRLFHFAKVCNMKKISIRNKLTKLIQHFNESK